MVHVNDNIVALSVLVQIYDRSSVIFNCIVQQIVCVITRKYRTCNIRVLFSGVWRKDQNLIHPFNPRMPPPPPLRSKTVKLIKSALSSERVMMTWKH